MVPLRNSVLVGGVAGAFDDEEQPVDPTTDVALAITLDDLAWWADALTPVRAAGQLVPGTFRLQAARMATAG